MAAHALHFDVNDSAGRDRFLRQTVRAALQDATGQEPALWGGMTAQHMLEHLAWVFEISTGRDTVECRTPPQLLERALRFLQDNRPTPRNFPSPVMGDAPPPLRYADFDTARTASLEQLDHFLGYSVQYPERRHTNPVLGPLDAERWHRSHYKHCIHHLLQFGLIELRESS